MMSPDAYAALYLAVLSLCLLLVVAAAIAAWFAWYHDRRRRARAFLRGYDDAIHGRGRRP